MANYNTYAVVDSRHGKTLLITSSARKATEMLETGRRIEVWNNNEKVATVTKKTERMMRSFVRLEKDYIRRKQEMATQRRKVRL